MELCIRFISGLPKPNKDRHALEIAEFVLRMLRIVSEMRFLARGMKVKLRIGINSGTRISYLNLKQAHLWVIYT